MIEVLPIYGDRPLDGVCVNTTSSAVLSWSRDLSPFFLGPCPLYGGFVSQTMENGWQYAKVYSKHVGPDGLPTDEYRDWARAGWSNPRANRYPVGKGKKPAFSWWDDQKLDYIEARKRIYVPLYARAVVRTAGFKQLKALVAAEKKTIYLLDYDAYPHLQMGMSLSDVLNDPNRKMGHAFVLLMLLTYDPALKECGI